MSVPNQAGTLGASSPTRGGASQDQDQPSSLTRLSQFSISRPSPSPDNCSREEKTSPYFLEPETSSPIPGPSGGDTYSAEGQSARVPTHGRLPDSASQEPKTFSLVLQLSDSIIPPPPRAVSGSSSRIRRTREWGSTTSREDRSGTARGVNVTTWVAARTTDNDADANERGDWSGRSTWRDRDERIRRRKSMGMQLMNSTGSRVSSSTFSVVTSDRDVDMPRKARAVLGQGGSQAFTGCSDRPRSACTHGRVASPSASVTTAAVVGLSITSPLAHLIRRRSHTDNPRTTTSMSTRWNSIEHSDDELDGLIGQHASGSGGHARYSRNGPGEPSTPRGSYQPGLADSSNSSLSNNESDNRDNDEGVTVAIMGGNHILAAEQTADSFTKSIRTRLRSTKKRVSERLLGLKSKFGKKG